MDFPASKHKVSCNNKRNLRFMLVASLLFAMTLMSSGLAQNQMNYSDTAAIDGFQEAPGLAERVAAGELPPVAERLPANPAVVEPVERIGEYGGTWNTAVLGPADTPWLHRTGTAWEGIVHFTPDHNAVIPNIAERVEVNEEGNEYTFYLREGMRWSDGHPFTADDIMFWYEDVFLNDELTPVKQAHLVIGDEPVTVEKLDDYTVVFQFSEPYGLFLEIQAGTGFIPTGHPRHYLEQFHIAHNPDGIDQLVQEAGANGWADLFALKSAAHQNPELPVLTAWMFTNALGDGSQLVAVRNPYYWKVDTEGNQLPYLDRIVYSVVEDVEVMLLQAMSGELDMHSRHIATAANRPVLFDNMERGNYRFYSTLVSDMNDVIIALNLTHENPNMREIFQNKDFRIGLSHAIDRQEIIDLVYTGQGEPWQASPRPESAFYHEQLAKQYIEYDVELANEYLDRAGYSERDAEGYRLGPDGNRITFTMEIADAHGLSWPDVAELLQIYWREVGIDMQYRVIDRSLHETRMDANQYDATVWKGQGGSYDAILQPRWYFPFEPASHHAKLWQQWYVDDPRGEEPPEDVKRQMELYDQVLTTADESRRNELFRQLLDITAEQFHVIGVSLTPPAYGLVKNNFRNVPDVLTFGRRYPSPTIPAQYFIEDQAQ